MHYSRTILVWLALAAGLLGTAVWAAEFSPDLENQLSQAKSSEFVSAIVILESPIDIRALDDQLHVEKASKVRRHDEVLKALKYNAESTQPKFRSELDEAKAAGELRGYTAYWIENLFVISASKNFIESLRQRGDVKYVTENFKPELIGPVGPVEVARDNSLDSRTVTSGIVAIGAVRVNEELGITGNGVIIGGCDTGVSGTHPALGSRWRGNFAPWWQCWRDDMNHTSQFPTDTGSPTHGTHTMGTMTGRAISGTDTIWVGCAPNARWIATNAINQSVGSDFDNDIVGDYQWFADPDTVTHSAAAIPDIVQNSWGVNTGLGYAQCYNYWNTVVLNCEAGGTVVTWSAGNEGTSGLRSPAIYSINETQIFSVGADSVDGHTPPYPLASFSSRGPTVCTPYSPNNIKPEISAPGIHVYSTLAPSSYGYMDGTSMAGPHVAGIVALMREACPDCDPTTIKMAIINTAIRTGYVTPPATENNLFGNGFIDGYNAVLSVMGNHGKLTGTVLDASTLAPVQATVEVVGGAQNTNASATGVYWLTLPSDSTYTIRYSLYGYMTEQRIVTVTTNDTTIQNVNLIPRPVVTTFSEDFETGGPGWTHDAASGWGDQWNITTQRAHSGTQSWKCGDTGTGDYAIHLDARLTSPVISTLPDVPVLHYWYQIQAERSGAYTDSAYDGGIVEISANGGAFSQVIPSTGYNKTFRYKRGGSLLANGPMPGQPCYSDSIVTWTEGRVDLSPFAGQPFQVRFRFGSDSATGKPGWFVDDVSITGLGTPTPNAPTQVVVLTDGSDLILHWTASGAPFYIVYTDTVATGDFATPVDTTTFKGDTLFGAAATGGEQQFYIVRSWNGY